MLVCPVCKAEYHGGKPDEAEMFMRGHRHCGEEARAEAKREIREQQRLLDDLNRECRQMRSGCEAVIGELQMLRLGKLDSSSWEGKKLFDALDYEIHYLKSGKWRPNGELLTEMVRRYFMGIAFEDAFEFHKALAGLWDERVQSVEDKNSTLWEHLNRDGDA